MCVGFEGAYFCVSDRGSDLFWFWVVANDVCVVVILVVAAAPAAMGITAGPRWTEEWLGGEGEGEGGEDG